MSKDDLKNVKEYQHLKRQLITIIVIIVVYVGCVALGLILFGLDSDINEATWGIILVATLVVTMASSPFIIVCVIEKVKIGKRLEKYVLTEAIVTTSCQSASHIGKKLQCSAYLINNKEPVNFNVYLDMYENGIELKTGDIVSIWYNEFNGNALFLTKK